MLFQHAKRIDLYAGLYPDLSDVVHADAGYLVTATGRHPVLGALIVIIDWLSDVAILHTQHAWPDWLTPFAESGEPVGGHLGTLG